MFSKKKERNIILLDPRQTKPTTPTPTCSMVEKKSNEHRNKNTNFIELRMIEKYIT